VTAWVQYRRRWRRRAPLASPPPRRPPPGAHRGARRPEPTRARSLGGCARASRLGCSPCAEVRVPPLRPVSPEPLSGPSGQGPAGGLRFRRPRVPRPVHRRGTTARAGDGRDVGPPASRRGGRTPPKRHGRRHLDEALASDVDYSLAVVTTPNATHVPIAETLLARGIPLVVGQAGGPDRRAGPATRGDSPRSTGRQSSPFRTGATTRTSVPSSACSRQARSGPSHGSSPAMSAGSPRSTLRAHGDGRRTPTPRPPTGSSTTSGRTSSTRRWCCSGTPERVYAEIATRRPGARVNDDVFIVALSYPGGLEAHLWMNAAAALPGPRFRLLGSVCGFEKYGMDTQENALLAGALPAAPGFGDEPAGSWGVLGHARVERAGPEPHRRLRPLLRAVSPIGSTTGPNPGAARRLDPRARDHRGRPSLGSERPGGRPRPPHRPT